MPCITCGHTMQMVCVSQDATRRCWCPRCGTLLTLGVSRQEHEAPSLVVRVRLLLEAIGRTDDVGLQQHCHTIGLYEASMLPDDRPV